MLFRETVAVCCENHTEHTNTLCWQNAVYINSVRTSQETHYFSATKPNRLMLFRETVAIYCEIHMKHGNTVCGHNTEVWYVNAGGTYSDHWTLKDWSSFPLTLYRLRYWQSSQINEKSGNEPWSLIYCRRIRRQRRVCRLRSSWSPRRVIIATSVDLGVL
jgi:hypothetical protein